uniref:Small ribosomal subunit protein uS5m n=1 Tax=Gasterosteus aculeatus aculeatus TaxID=481459 RepID=G3N4R0_GASAC
MILMAEFRRLVVRRRTLRKSNMAASIRLCCALRVSIGGAAPLLCGRGAVQASQLASRAPLQRGPAAPRCPPTAWQQSRQGSFFNKLTADELWKGVLAESGSGARKGRGKRTKRKMKKDLNRGQIIGEGRGGFLWPGLNSPVLRDGTLQSMSRRGESEQLEMQAELVRQRDEWERRRKMRVKRERGWTGNSMGGTSLGPPDPGPNGETYEDFDSRVIEVKSVFNMTGREGRKRSISCLVAVGNGNGAAGFALGKAADRMTALRKAKNRAIHYLYYIERYNEQTIYHDIQSKFKRTTLRMKKQNEGYGLHCHRAVITMCRSSSDWRSTRRWPTRSGSTWWSTRRSGGRCPGWWPAPRGGARAQPEAPDEVPDTRLNWDDVRAAQGVKRSIWGGVKRTIW